MSLAREEKHLPVIIAACFVGNFVFGGIGQAMGANSFGQQFSWQWSSLLFMAGTCLYAAKLHTDRWHISSSGFILLSIGQGIFYTLQHTNTTPEDQGLYAAGIMVYIPGMIFLCYYSGFPIWLRVFELIATLPFLLIMIKIDQGKFQLSTDGWLNPLGFFMIQLTSLIWAYFALRPYRKTKVQE